MCTTDCHWCSANCLTPFLQFIHQMISLFLASSFPEKNFLCRIYSACYITCLFHDPCFHFLNHFQRTLPIMKLLTTQWSVASCFFHPLTFKYSTQQFSKTPSQQSLSNMRQVLHTYKLTGKHTHIYTRISSPLFSYSWQKSKGLCKSL